MHILHTHNVRHRLGPLAVAVLTAAYAHPPDVSRLIQLIEGEFDGPPDLTEALDALSAGRLSFALDPSDQVRFWVDDRPVAGLIGPYAQGVLRHLCRRPNDRISGRELQRKDRTVKNAATGVHQIRLALGEAAPESANWLLTGPIRWADGVRPVPRGAARRPGDIG